MNSQDYKALEICAMEIIEQKKTIDELVRQNAELEQKVKDMYGAYETFQYACAGQCNNMQSEIERLRDIIEKLKEELKKSE
jgi:hypothetical protein